MPNGFNFAIAGATGAVGAELIKLLEEGDLPVSNLKLLASARSAGKELKFRGEPLKVEELKQDSFSGVDLAFFSAGAGTSREFAPAAVKQGAIVVDNSSAFRMDSAVPLVIPEINPEDAAAHRGTIAVPNCTTIVALMALYPLHKAFHVNRVVAASYQAVSGAGAKAIAELTSQTQAYLAGQPVKESVFPHPIAFNVLPQVDTFLDSGYTNKAPGIDLIDNPSRLEYPMPLTTSGKKTCAVGRLRIDWAFENGLAFWSCGDQLLKGAALNAVQIAELVLR